MKAIIGIIGGAGPDAAIDLQMKLSYEMKKQLNARSDAEHVRVIVDNDPQLAATFNSTNSLKHYVASAKSLEMMGANLILIACNAAHIHIDDIQKLISVPILNMIEVTAEFIKQNNQDIITIALLASHVTIKSELYQKALSRYNIAVELPNYYYQGLLLLAISGIKAGCMSDKNLDKRKLYEVYSRFNIYEQLKDKVPSPETLIYEIIEYLQKNKLYNIILGCTELPISLKKTKYNRCNIFDPTAILAEKAIQFIKCGNMCK
jgi:aspartate racemase